MTLFQIALPGFETWKGIYDENLSKVWKNEDQELRTVAVLFHALQGELKKIENRVNDEVSQLRKKISQRDQLSEELKTFQLDNSPQSFTFPKASFGSPHSKNPSPKTPVIFSKPKVKIETTNNLTKNVGTKSPDLFISDVNNDDEINEILVDQTLAQNSPPLNKTKAKSVIYKMDQQSKKSVTKNIFPAPKRSKVNNENNVPACADDSFDFDLTYVEGFSQKIDCDADKVKVEPKIFKEPPKMKMKPDPQPEPVIRGNARKFMNATSCRDCEKFYNGVNLPSEKKQQFIKNCSKHRYVYQSREETQPGFWNMTFPDV